jgi:hypothetical protein
MVYYVCLILIIDFVCFAGVGPSSALEELAAGKIATHKWLNSETSQRRMSILSLINPIRSLIANFPQSNIMIA